MKKIILLVSFISNVAYCQTTICDATFPKPQVMAAYGKTYSNSISISYAQIIVSNYLSSPAKSQIDMQTGFFLFDAGTLFKFIYNINQANVIGSATPLQEMAFILGRDQTGSLTMIVAGYTANHNTPLYYNDQSITNAVLGNPLAGDLTDPFEKLSINANPSSLSLTQMICTGISFPASNLQTFSTFIPKANVPALISAYTIPPLPAGIPISFFFDAGMLASFLTTTGIQNVATVFAREGNTIKLVIIGVDNVGNPIGMNVGGFIYCLEHCYPCPADCPGVTPKIELEQLTK